MRRSRRVEEDRHADRWMVSYADFMTLMFALFVVLFASAYHDKKAVQRVSSAVKNGFHRLGYFPTIPADGSRAGESWKYDQYNRELRARRRGHRRRGVAKELNKALGKEIERQEVGCE